MNKFKKVINYRVISLFVAVIFLFTNTAYGIDLSKKTYLRNNVLGNSKQGQARLNQALNVASDPFFSDYLQSQGRNLTVAISNETFHRKFSNNDLLWYGSGFAVLFLIAFVNAFLKNYLPYNWFIHGHLNDLLSVPAIVYFQMWASLAFSKFFGKEKPRWVEEFFSIESPLVRGRGMFFAFSVLEIISGFLNIFKIHNMLITAAIGCTFDVFDLLSFAVGFGIVWLSSLIKDYFQGPHKEDPDSFFNDLFGNPNLIQSAELFNWLEENETSEYYAKQILKNLYLRPDFKESVGSFLALSRYLIENKISATIVKCIFSRLSSQPNPGRSSDTLLVLSRRLVKNKVPVYAIEAILYNLSLEPISKKIAKRWLNDKLMLQSIDVLSKYLMENKVPDVKLIMIKIFEQPDFKESVDSFLALSRYLIENKASVSVVGTILNKLLYELDSRKMADLFLALSKYLLRNKVSITATEKILSSLNQKFNYKESKKIFKSMMVAKNLNEIKKLEKKVYLFLRDPEVEDVMRMLMESKGRSFSREVKIKSPAFIINRIPAMYYSL